MEIVGSVVLACVTLVLAGFALCQSGYNLWRFHFALARKRRSARAAIWGTSAEVAAKTALLLMEIITVLFLTMGVTPSDALLALGLRLPTTANRWLFMYGSQIQVIMGTLSFIGLNHSIKSCHFPREQQDVLVMPVVPVPPGSRIADHSIRQGEGRKP